MNAELHAVTWTVGGAASFSLIGGLFGALAGGLSWRNGNATGSFIGTRLARAIQRVVERDLTPTQKGIIVGAADGAVFLGIVGILVGLIAHFSGEEPSRWLWPTFLLVMALLSGAVLFGLLAYGILHLKVHSIFTISVGGLIGGSITALNMGAEHIVPGAVAGMIVGSLLYYLISRK